MCVDERGVIVKIVTRNDEEIHGIGDGKEAVVRMCKRELGWDDGGIECVVFEAGSDGEVGGSGGERFFFPGFVGES